MFIAYEPFTDTKSNRHSTNVKSMAYDLKETNDAEENVYGSKLRSLNNVTFCANYFIDPTIPHGKDNHCPFDHTLDAKSLLKNVEIDQIIHQNNDISNNNDECAKLALTLCEWLLEQLFCQQKSAHSRANDDLSRIKISFDYKDDEKTRKYLLAQLYCHYGDCLAFGDKKYKQAELEYIKSIDTLETIAKETDNDLKNGKANNDNYLIKLSEIYYKYGKLLMYQLKSYNKAQIKMAQCIKIINDCKKINLTNIDNQCKNNKNNSNDYGVTLTLLESCYHITFGHLVYLMKKYKASMSKLVVACDLDVNINNCNIKSLYLCGIVCYKQGEFDKSRDYFDKCLKTIENTNEMEHKVKLEYKSSIGKYIKKIEYFTQKNTQFIQNMAEYGFICDVNDSKLDTLPTLAQIVMFDNNLALKWYYVWLTLDSNDKTNSKKSRISSMIHLIEKYELNFPLFINVLKEKYQNTNQNVDQRRIQQIKDCLSVMKMQHHLF